MLVMRSLVFVFAWTQASHVALALRTDIGALDLAVENVENSSLARWWGENQYEKEFNNGCTDDKGSPCILRINAKKVNNLASHGALADSDVDSDGWLLSFTSTDPWGEGETETSVYASRDKVEKINEELHGADVPKAEDINGDNFRIKDQEVVYKLPESKGGAWYPFGTISMSGSGALVLEVPPFQEDRVKAISSSAPCVHDIGSMFCCSTKHGKCKESGDSWVTRQPCSTNENASCKFFRSKSYGRKCRCKKGFCANRENNWQCEPQGQVAIQEAKSYYDDRKTLLSHVDSFGGNTMKFEFPLAWRKDFSEDFNDGSTRHGPSDSFD